MTFFPDSVLGSLVHFVQIFVSVFLPAAYYVNRGEIKMTDSDKTLEQRIIWVFERFNPLLALASTIEAIIWWRVSTMDDWSQLRDSLGCWKKALPGILLVVANFTFCGDFLSGLVWVFLLGLTALASHLLFSWALSPAE